MIRSTLKLRDFAQRLIANEATETKSSATKPPTAFAVLEKIRPQLAQVLGDLGFRAVLSRALVLANEQVHRHPVDSFEGLAELEAKVGPKEIAEGRVVLLAELLGLLTELIGEHLTLQLVRQGLPNCPTKF